MVTAVALFSSFINTCAFDTTSWVTFSEDQSAENLSGEVKIFHVSLDLLFDLPPPSFCTFECKFMFRARSWNLFLPVGATTDLFPFTGESAPEEFLSQCDIFNQMPLWISTEDNSEVKLLFTTLSAKGLGLVEWFVCLQVGSTYNLADDPETKNKYEA